MTIYVDELFNATPRTAQARKHGTRWCHMTTDGDIEELHRFAESIGLRRSYFQDHVRRALKHYDLTPSKRALAISKGAVEVNAKEHLLKAVKLDLTIPQSLKDYIEQGKLEL